MKCTGFFCKLLLYDDIPKSSQIIGMFRIFAIGEHFRVPNDEDH